MNKMLKGAALGLLALAAAGAPALAADWNSGAGSIKDLGGSAAVPVPAPVPVPVYKPEWYFRIDAGIGVLGGDRDGSESGLTYGLLDSPGIAGPTPFGTRSSWINADFDTFVTYGGGVGFRWSDRFRTDVTLEAGTQGELNVNGTESYIRHGNDAFYATNYGPSPHDGAGNGTERVDVTVRDVTKASSMISLFNAYYDFGQTARGLVPYVGAGLGVVVHHLSRSHETTETTCDLTAVPPCGASFTRANYSAAAKQTDFGLAAALTAGVTYNLSEMTALDFNYRYLYLEGASATLNVTDANGVTHRSKVSIGDASEHQLRAGLRFNIH